MTPFGRVALGIRRGLEYRAVYPEIAMSQRRKRVERMPIVYPNAAGLDIGSGEIYAWVPPDRARDNVKAFGTFTADLNALADWLAAYHIDTVAMESTGVFGFRPLNYWKRAVSRATWSTRGICRVCRAAKVTFRTVNGHRSSIAWAF